MTSAIRRLRLAAGLASSLCAATALADTTPQSLPFTQDWSDGTMLTTTNVWTGVPGIVGHRGDGLASAGADPQTVLAPDDTAPVLNVAVNQATFGSSGGLAEFAIANPVVGMQGSGTADAPYLKIHLDTTGESDIQVSYVVRDLDPTDDTTQQVALQYRVGGTGNFIKLSVSPDAKSYTVSIPAHGQSRTHQTKSN